MMAKERFQQPSRKIVRVHPPQYKGRLSERVAAYDKLVSTCFQISHESVSSIIRYQMTNLILFDLDFYLKRHHSICIDIILDMAVNVMEMTARDVIAAIAFVAFDTNGTILVSGVFERVMHDVQAFRGSVKSHGMYQALVTIIKEIARDHGSKISGCSEGPRYIYPNERRPMQKDISDTFISKALELCNQLRTQVLFQDKSDYSNFKDFNSRLPKGCSTSQYKKEYKSNFKVFIYYGEFYYSSITMASSASPSSCWF